MNALPIIVGALCILAIAYRYYSAFIAAKVLALDDSRPVPSQTMYDGHNYYPPRQTPITSQSNPGRNPNCAASTGPIKGPAPEMAAKWCPNKTHLLVG